MREQHEQRRPGQASETDISGNSATGGTIRADAPTSGDTATRTADTNSIETHPTEPNASPGSSVLRQRTFDAARQLATAEHETPSIRMVRSRVSTLVLEEGSVVCSAFLLSDSLQPSLSIKPTDLALANAYGQ